MSRSTELLLEQKTKLLDRGNNVHDSIFKSYITPTWLQGWISERLGVPNAANLCVDINPK